MRRKSTGLFRTPPLTRFLPSTISIGAAPIDKISVEEQCCPNDRSLIAPLIFLMRRFQS